MNFIRAAVESSIKPVCWYEIVDVNISCWYKFN